MSKVYSFRLNDKNPREVQASVVIETWMRKGFSLRHTITEACIKLADDGDRKTEVDIILEHLEELINSAQNRRSNKIEDQTDPLKLSPSFISSVKKSVKLGIES